MHVARGSVLLVEDDELMMRTLQRHLTRWGYRCTSTGSPELALEMLGADAFDAVVTDLRLPLEDGAVFAMRAAERHVSTPVVVVTGETHLPSIHRLLGPFADRVTVLPKPIDPDALERLLRRLVDARFAPEVPDHGYLVADSLVRALALRDVETENHSRRVAAWMNLVSEAMGLDEDHRRRNHLGALLHDIGKIGVPDAILRKPGRLDPREWSVMRQHPLLGQNIVDGIVSLRCATDVVAYHHERWDGAGYPFGLAGEAIPLGARIFAVLDTYDAMAHRRHYREGAPYERVMAELDRHAGAQFDPEIVAVVKDVDRERWELVGRSFPDVGPATRSSMPPARSA